MLKSTYYFKHLFLLQSVENPASQQADKINRLFNYFNVAAAGMLLLVGFLIAYICIRYRQKKGESSEPVETKPNKWLEVLMIGGPFLLLVFFFSQTLSVMHSVTPSEKAMARKPDVIITGHQWWWQIEYPNAKVLTANEVHLPVKTPLLLEMRSADVIHDWWVPELGNKMDLIPSKKNYLSLNINKPGIYTGACSEFCGAQHAWMRIKVIAQTPSDFKKWLAENEKDADQPTDTLAETGARLFQTKTCANCHRIQGTAATATAGPDLTHLAERDELLTGLLSNNKENLFKWVDNPQQIKPGAHMPDFKFKKDTVDAIVHYLLQLK
ncbi:MAG: cytochrome c oxidase subunit II [Ginsengibacter sp.]